MVISNSPSSYAVRSTVPFGPHGPLQTFWKYLATEQVSVAPGSVEMSKDGVLSLPGEVGGAMKGAAGGVVSNVYDATAVWLTFPEESVTVTVRVYVPSGSPVRSR